ncbi:hypothetical protein MBLNU459_g6583t1 [Dothideomycetes sp. NU459]
MSGELSRQRSGSSKSRHEGKARPIPPHPTLTPENIDREFDPCAATGSYLLYAQRNVILCLHHDTLAIERRFDLHKEDILWISADTVSERGAGRLAVSYDTGNTAIVWDISTGREVATFTAYEPIRVAAWMRNGNIAFGNSQGNVVLFEPSTSEHISARTIYDPITAIAPATDNRTFAIGHLNGSILIVTLQPFTIVHTLTTSRPPSRISGLAWHGSSSRQKSEMLATQTVDGDLRVWSIPKTPNGDSPNIIRVLNKPESKSSGPCWFAWSKNGRIVQHADGETRAWDVRTKTVTCENIPTVDGITGIANYGPTSTLFTLGRNHTVQQYDVNPTGKPLQVVTVQHAPANTPPSPPNSIEEKNIHKTPATAVLATAPAIPGYFDAESSEGEGFTMSPLQRIAHEMDQLEEERRDKVGALSPVSSRASSVSSKSSNGGKLAPSYRYDRASSSQASDVSYNDGTEFSFGQPSRHARESISIRSTSSYAPSKYRSSGLRNQVLRSPEETEQTMHMELFSFVKARLRDVPFRTPHYGHAARTPDVLRKEMLSVVFGWNHDIEELVRDEVSRHKPGSASCVLLSKWLGDLGADSMATMIGSESMSSSDWMLLALSSMGQDSQRQVGEAFVQRLLEKGDIHPAVAILLGLGEHNDAVEVYVSRAYYTEAVLLTCLIFPADWQRQSYLVRKMGELAMTSEPWFSPRAQDAVFTAQKEQFLGPALASPPLSPPSATGSSRMAFKNPPLKLITTFGDKGVPVLPSRGQATPMSNTLGVTPIAESALTPGGAASWLNNTHRKDRDPSSARTATPGAYNRKRFPTRSESAHTRDETPQTASRDFALPSKRLDNMPPLSGGSPQRSRTVDPESVVRFMPARSGASTSASVGLPATPRAMKIPRYRDGETVDDGDIPAVPEVPDNLSQLASAVYQHSPDKENDYVADLLPSSVFGQRVPQPPPRSASAPLERSGLPSHPAYKAALPPSNRRASIGRGHARQLTPVEHHIPTQPQRSPPAVTASIDQALHDGHVVVVEQDAPIMLPELQHLAGPPPPPPPPLMFSGAPNINGSSLGVINIAIEEDSAMVIDVTPTLERAATSSPSAHRRGRGSVSEGIGSRLRNVTDRMRSRSGSRTMSPPMASEPYKPSPSPYESLPHITSRRESLSRAKSPYESSISSAAGSEVNMPPPSQGRGTPALSEQSIAPDGSSQPPSRTGSAFQGYRHPREVRANMPPETLQQGVYQPGNMI